MTPPIIQLINRSAETENKSAINEENSGWNKFGLNKMTIITTVAITS